MHNLTKRNRLVSKHGRINAYTRLEIVALKYRLCLCKGRWAAEPQIPEGLLHVDHRPVLVRDLHGLRRLLLLVLVGLRSGLVPGGLCPWRPGGGQAEGARCVCGQHQGLHLLLPLQPGDPAHDRLRRSSNYGAVLDGDHRDEPAEHLGGGDPGRNSSILVVEVTFW